MIADRKYIFQYLIFNRAFFLLNYLFFDVYLKRRTNEIQIQCFDANEAVYAHT